MITLYGLHILFTRLHKAVSGSVLIRRLTQFESDAHGLVSSEYLVFYFVPRFMGSDDAL